jgi:hypothetical protein
LVSFAEFRKKFEFEVDQVHEKLYLGNQTWYRALVLIKTFSLTSPVHWSSPLQWDVKRIRSCLEKSSCFEKALRSPLDLKQKKIAICLGPHEVHSLSLKIIVFDLWKEKKFALSLTKLYQAQKLVFWSLFTFSFCWPLATPSLRFSSLFSRETSPRTRKCHHGNLKLMDKLWSFPEVAGPHPDQPEETGLDGLTLICVVSSLTKGSRGRTQVEVVHGGKLKSYDLGFSLKISFIVI